MVNNKIQESRNHPGQFEILGGRKEVKKRRRKEDPKNKQNAATPGPPRHPNARWRVPKKRNKKQVDVETSYQTVALRPVAISTPIQTQNNEENNKNADRKKKLQGIRNNNKSSQQNATQTTSIPQINSSSSHLKGEIRLQGDDVFMVRIQRVHVQA